LAYWYIQTDFGTVAIMQQAIAHGVHSSKRTIWLLVAVLMLLTAALYGRTWQYSFLTLDDDACVTDTLSVYSGLSVANVKWAFGIRNPAGFWIPLTWLSLQFDATLSGGVAAPRFPPRHEPLPWVSPTFPSATVYHLHNVLLQMVAAVMLFLFLQRATQATWAAFATAALWAVHPLRVESVAWVTERKDVLAGVFGFGAMYAYVVWAQRGKWWRYGACCVAFALSLMAKPMMVCLPAVLVVCDFWPLGRIGSWSDLWRRIVEKWGLVLPALGVAVVTLMAQHVAQVTPVSRALGEKVTQAILAYGMYLVRQVRIWDLAAYYPRQPAEGWEVAVALVAMAAISGVAVWQWRKLPWLIAGWLWFLVAMVPMSGIVQSGAQAYADRFSYWPTVGLWVMVCHTVAAVVEGSGRVGRQVWLAAAVAVGLVFMGFTWRQVSYWKDTETLGLRALEVTEKNWLAHQILARAYLREGENELAEKHFRQSAELYPLFYEGWFLMGLLHLALDKNDDAIHALGMAEKLKPQHARIRFYRAVAMERVGRKVEAIMEYWYASQFAPENAAVAEALSRAMQDKEAFEEAAKYIPQLLQWKKPEASPSPSQ